MDQKNVSCHFCKTKNVVATKPSATAAALPHLLPSQWVCLEENSGWRKTGHWPETVKVRKQRNNFKKPRILQSPLYEKALKTLI